MHLLESFTLGKREDQKKNEDGFFFSERWAAVVDGCSSIHPQNEEKESSGVIARKLILKTIENLDPKTTKEELFKSCNEAIRSYYKDEDKLTYALEYSASRAGAYLAVVSKYHRELWILGDCQALINGAHYSSPKKIDTLMEDLRTLFIEDALLKGATIEQLLKNTTVIDYQLSPFFKLQSNFQNVDPSYVFTYYTLDGFFYNYEQILAIPLPKDPTEVVLATDGYPYLAPTLEETETKLTEAIAADPLLYKVTQSVKGVEKGNASFDDRTYLRFTL